jgi:hypothetical protein
MRGRDLLPFLVSPILGLAGCQVGDLGANNGDDLAEPLCEGPLGPPRDPASLPACCPDYGGAHCLGGDVVPAELHDFLGPCDGGGYCVPDPFIETGGVFEPQRCASLEDAEGVCLSGCIPQVDEYFGILPQDVCGDSERCVPCINPFDGTETGACDIAYSCEGGQGGGDDPPAEAQCPHEGPPLIDPATLPACAPGAHCLASGLVPTEMADRLADCPDGQSKCVPDEFIETAGNYVPPTCDSVAGAEGRCLSTALPEVAEQAELLPQSTCEANHLCVPCFSPLDSTETGACRLSCDPGPSEGPTQLPACCDGRGTCVPASAAGENADQLGEDECPEDEGLLCAPNVFLEEGGFTPPSCETGLIQVIFGEEFAEGACLPECLPAVDNFLIGQDGCDEGFKCAPCLNPLTGEPSGACEL